MSVRHAARVRVPETEKGFMHAILQLAHLYGWLSYHAFDSRRSTPGFPDVCFAKPGCPVLLIEVKTATGRVTPEQRQWLEVLGGRPGIHAEVWRPGMWTHIEALLKYGMP